MTGAAIARRGVWLRLTASGALFAALWAATPPDAPGFPLCGFHWLTGRPCPLCGLTHALCALAKGHWAQAAGFNALGPLALAMLLSLAWNFPLRARLWTAGTAAFAVYGLCRVAGLAA